MYGEALELFYRERTSLGMKLTQLLTREARKSPAELSEITPRFEMPYLPSTAWPGAAGQEGAAPEGCRGGCQCCREPGGQTRLGQEGRPPARLHTCRARQGPGTARSAGTCGKDLRVPVARRDPLPDRSAPAAAKEPALAPGGGLCAVSWRRGQPQFPSMLRERGWLGGPGRGRWQRHRGREGGGVAAAEGSSLRRRAAGRGGCAAPPAPRCRSSPPTPSTRMWVSGFHGAPSWPGPPPWPPCEVTLRPVLPPTPVLPPAARRLPARSPSQPSAAGSCPASRVVGRGGSSGDQAALPDWQSRCGGERSGRGCLRRAGGGGCGLVGDNTGAAKGGCCGRSLRALRGAAGEGGEPEESCGRQAGLLSISNAAA